MSTPKLGHRCYYCKTIVLWGEAIPFFEDYEITDKSKRKYAHADQTICISALTKKVTRLERKVKKLQKALEYELL